MAHFCGTTSSSQEDIIKQEKIARLCQIICNYPVGVWRSVENVMKVEPLRDFIREIRACCIRYSARFHVVEMECACGQTWLAPRDSREAAWMDKVCPARPPCGWEPSAVRIRPFETALTRIASFGTPEQCLRLLDQCGLLHYYITKWLNPELAPGEMRPVTIPRSILGQLMSLPRVLPVAVSGSRSAQQRVEEQSIKRSPNPFAGARPMRRTEEHGPSRQDQSHEFRGVPGNGTWTRSKRPIERHVVEEWW